MFGTKKQINKDKGLMVIVSGDGDFRNTGGKVDLLLFDASAPGLGNLVITSKDRIVDRVFYDKPKELSSELIRKYCLAGRKSTVGNGYCSFPVEYSQAKRVIDGLRIDPRVKMMESYVAGSGLIN